MPNPEGIAQFRRRTLTNWINAYAFGDFLVRAGRYYYRFERSYLAQSLVEQRYEGLMDKIPEADYQEQEDDEEKAASKDDKEKGLLSG